MVNRIQPAMPVQAYQTYQAVRPVKTHTRAGTCREVDCTAYANGWTTTIDVSTDLGRRQANYIRMRSGRAYTAAQAGDVVTFTFPPGQKCFTDHRVDIDKPTIYLMRGGDWRATTFEAQRFNQADWINHFAEHQAKLAETIEKG